MKLKKLKICTVLLLWIGLIDLQAQETIVTAGGVATGSGGSSSYSIGQVVYTTDTGASNSISQGVQQPYKILVITGIELAKGINLSYLAYPNPTSNFLTLKVENYKVDNLSYQLFDMNGRILISNKITVSETELDLKNLNPANYFRLSSNCNSILFKKLKQMIRLIC